MTSSLRIQPRLPVPSAFSFVPTLPSLSSHSHSHSSLLLPPSSSRRLPSALSLVTRTVRLRSPHPIRTRNARIRLRPRFSASVSRDGENATASAVVAAPSTLGRGATFSRRRIGLYELHREGVDPTTLLRNNSRFGQIYILVLTTLVTTLFIIPITTGVQLPEAALASLVAFTMGVYAIDTLAFNAALSTAIVAAFHDRLRVARHEAAHLLVAHLLGFCVQGYVLPFPKQMFAAARGIGDPPGVSLAPGVAHGDMRRLAAVGLAGMAGELLSYDTCKGADGDMGEVSRRVRAAIRDRSGTGENRSRLDIAKGGDADFLSFANEDEEVLHVVRWGLLVATRLVKVHSDAFDAVVDAMLRGDSVDRCLALVDRLAVSDGLVEQPFGT